MQARELCILILDINEVESIDIAIDGVDEIDRNFNATKGGGGALFRKKMVADLAKEVIWIMDESKVVDNLGQFLKMCNRIIIGTDNGAKIIEANE